MNLTKTQWPLGWTPSADGINGDPNGLLRADNLQLDEQGSLTLIRGYKQLNATPFGDVPYVLYSRPINGIESIWTALGAGGNGAVVRSANGMFTDSVTVMQPGLSRCSFGDALGKVFMTNGVAGTGYIKDDTINPYNWGLPTPNPPSISSVNQESLAFGQILSTPTGTQVVYNLVNWNLVEGTPADFLQSQGNFQSSVSASTFEGQIIGNWGSPVDTTDMGNGSSPGGSAYDLFSILFAPFSPSNVTSVTIDFLLNPNPLVAENNTDYYTFVWNTGDLTPGENVSGVSTIGNNTSTTLTAVRNAFTRSGSNQNLDWTTVTGIRFTVQMIGLDNNPTTVPPTDETAPEPFFVSSPQWIGGSQGGLNGTYLYAQQYVDNSGNYTALSELSADSVPLPVINGAVNITVAGSLSGTLGNVTQVNLYRKTIPTTVVDSNGTLIVNAAIPNYMLVATTTPGSNYKDILSDNFILEQNIPGNPFLQSVQHLNDQIYDMEGLYYERMLLMGVRNIYLCDNLNPDCIDTRFTLTPSGDIFERNLWINRLVNGVLILGTSKNLYEIAGTLEVQPDGTIDVTFIPIGEAYPPLSNDCANVNGGLFYIASDGIRVTQGATSTLVSPQLRLLFQGDNRFGVAPVQIVTADSGRYAIGVGKTKLYCCLPLTDGTRRLMVYDLVTQQWMTRYTDPVSIFVTPTDRVLLGYGESANPTTAPGLLFQLDVGKGFQNSTGGLYHGFTTYFQTVYDSNQQPRNRKDTFTLKTIMDTGNALVSVFIDKDNSGNWVALGNVACNGLQTQYFPLTGVTLGFRYAVKIVDVNSDLLTFKLYEMSIEYDPRPEQLDYLRIQPSNLGTMCRKRFTNYAFVIDTLGNNITFTPIVDNAIPVTPSQVAVNTITKGTFILYFTEEVIGTDISGILSGGVFEFYQLNTEEIVSEKLPTPVQFLVIPANNYGTPNRKRHSSYKFQINTRGFPVQFTPIIDGVSYASATYTTQTKQTVEYFFTPFDGDNGDVIGIDIGGILQTVMSTPFEFYGVIVPQQIEQLPDRLEYFRIPQNDYGVPNRKRHTSYKFQINTNGNDVNFTPILDNSVYPSVIFNTPYKQTVEYFFPQGDIIGIDISGILQGDSPFEFYGVVVPQTVEKLPDRLEYLRIPNTNYGVAARKRIRTIPIVIDTYGENVTFVPIVDGVLQGNTTTLNCSGKTTLYHFFINDVFGTDFGGILKNASGPFEFYELGQPEDVEVLPVPKKYDQLGPIRFDKIGKLFTLRFRLIMNGSTTSLPFTILGDSNKSDPTYDLVPLLTGTIPMTPGIDYTYEVQLPKSVNTNMARIVLGPTSDSFHRYDMQVRVSDSGMETDSKWIPVR